MTDGQNDDNQKKTRNACLTEISTPEVSWMNFHDIYNNLTAQTEQALVTPARMHHN